MDPTTPKASGSGYQVFVTTHWSVVMAARDGRSDAALEALCQAYWPPIYRFLRCQGNAPAEAQDLTQEFFAQLLERDHLQHLHHRNGRFRSFLLVFLKHFLADKLKHDRALKRGGGYSVVSLDAFEQEERQRLEPSHGWTPELAFERRWADAVLARAAVRLEGEYNERDQTVLFDALKNLRLGEHGPEGYAALASRLGTTESAIKSAALRMRRRHQELLREEILQTVGHAKDVDDEIRHLLNVLSGDRG